MISWSDFQSKGNKPDHMWIQQKLNNWIWGKGSKTIFQSGEQSAFGGGNGTPSVWGIKFNNRSLHCFPLCVTQLFEEQFWRSPVNISSCFPLFETLHYGAELNITSVHFLLWCVLLHFSWGYFPPHPEIDGLSTKVISEICPGRAACLKGVDWLRVGRAVHEKLARKNWERSFPRLWAWSVVQERVQ